MPIEVFKSVEDMFNALQEDQEAAALRIPVWAGTIKTGDFFIRTVNFYGDPLTIWSEVLPCIEEDEEENEVVVPYDGSAYRFTRSFSCVCPEGELGDVHVSTVGRLVTREEFEAAKKAGWR